jgi:hypothetical protein
MKISNFWDITFFQIQLTFWKNMSAPSSELKIKPNKKSPLLLYAGILFGFLVKPEDGGDMFLRNVD